MINMDNIVAKVAVSQQRLLGVDGKPVVHAPAKTPDFKFIKTQAPFHLELGDGKVVHFRRPIRQLTKAPAPFGEYGTDDEKEADKIWEVASKSNQFVFEKISDTETEVIYGNSTKCRRERRKEIDQSRLDEQIGNGRSDDLQESAPGRADENNRGNQQGQQPEGRA